MIKIENSNNFSQAFRELAWEIFFTTKGRGISLRRHFPCLYVSSSRAQSFEAREFGQVIGGLVLKTEEYFLEEKQYKVGLIGLVCVHPNFRGLGVGRQLLTQVIEYAKFNSFDYLTLWTNQHDIYSGLGFEVSDRWNYGWIEQPEIDICKASIRMDDFPGVEDKIKPLPPFATSRYEINNENAAIVYLCDFDGVIVADYSGEPSLVAKILFDQFPKKWRLNFIENDPLVDALRNLGLKLNASPTNLQMWLALSERDPLLVVPNSMLISVLDRI
ncbi:GNAT family N-acetyltransferase [Undibacterium oligocarboniphilum]|uniref:GNAT family N-acetyltransferase n=1 Tax=Undibacterium oligocarboniphilum TaxID=666702 RepID=A0A850QDH4_9BURK|nr:GNAT family N-acetyltransferase [Undibacterium oligocarboniphilum]MBC3868957.1 GNAT family N-acetyltransferase [Undibacterium oligocarboniphilum]NVO76937.1 GNAT family N-acetyltransferase [Undibacterium oligocarboniphilum]